MSSAPFRISAPPTVNTRVALEPVYTALTSMALLNAADRVPDVDPWVPATAARLTDAERHANRLVFEAFGAALTTQREWPSFEDYLDDLAATAPRALRDRFLAELARPAAHNGPADAAQAPPTTRQLLDDLPIYLRQIARAYPSDPVDTTLQREAHVLLREPEALHALIVGHLRAMWQRYLADEMRAQQHFRSAMVQVLQGREWPSTTAAEAIRTFIGRELAPAISTQLDGVQHIVFTVSPHIGPFAARFGSPDTIWVFVRGRAPAGRPNQRPTLELPVRQAPIKRVELLGPLSALADDIRLRILELLAGSGELPAQELIARLELSQSGVSRHLKQLVASGFVDERRGDGANKLYRLSEARVEWVFFALRQLLAQAVAPAPSVEPVPQTPELRRFVNAEGKLYAWPARRRDQTLVLEFLAAKFEIGQKYTEREVNEIIDDSTAKLTRPPTTNRGADVPIDFVTLRRELYDAHLLNRTPDGTRYWREENGEHRV